MTKIITLYDNGSRGLGGGGRSAWSRDIDDLGGVEDVLAAEPVLALLDGFFADEVGFAVAEGFQLGLHVHFFKEASFGEGLVGDQDINVAIGVKVIAQDGPEEGEFGHLPALAKFGEGFGGDGEAVFEFGVELEGGHDWSPRLSLLEPDLASFSGFDWPV
jgi:hypothetical protein